MITTDKPSSPRATSHADRSVLVNALLKRYSQLEQRSAGVNAERSYRLNSLQLASALLEKAALPPAIADALRHHAVLGPTQAGKSSLVNLLLGSQVAGVSALAGHTVQAHGFSITPLQKADREAVAAVMSGLRESGSGRPDREALDEYTLGTIGQPAAALIGSGVVWDTPDFDSIESGNYRSAVMHAAALADVLILTTSKDKYADRTVWDILTLIRQLGTPLVLVVNKLDPADEATVLDSLHQRYRTAFSAEPPTIVTLPFVRSQHAEPAWPAAAVGALRLAVQQGVSGIDGNARRAAIERFIDAHWARWLEPVSHELAAATRWQQLVDQAMADANQRYVERYLNDPDKYDTFNRALAELLTLLEIPGVAAALARTRRWVTWPARTLLGLGRQAMQGDDNGKHGVDQEQHTLEGLCEQVLTRLQGDVMDQPRLHPEAALWWEQLDQRLRRVRPTLRTAFQGDAERYRADFEPRVKAAAQRLYTQLQEQPRLLNTLRATRVTTDAAGVALAVKSGGLAPADLILAPAMLAVTSLLTESALGRYLDRIKRELKARQKDEAARLFDRGLQQPLATLRDDLYGDDALVLDAELATLLRGRPVPGPKAS